MDNLITVQVSVPEKRLGEFHQFFGAWLSGTNGPESIPAGSAAGEDSPGDHSIRLRGWGQGSRDELVSNARYVYERLSPNARRLLDYWMDHPGTPMTGQELADELGLPGAGSIPGSLSSVGKWCKEAHRKHPFRWVDALGGGSYSMDADVAEIFRLARGKTSR